MTRVKTKQRIYGSFEVFGKTNTWKTSFLLSVTNYRDKYDKAFKDKTQILLFTNESTYAESLALLPREKQDDVIVYQHRSLDEFMEDWREAGQEFNLYDGALNVYDDLTGFESRVKAVLLDEMLFLYHEYVEQYKERKKLTELRPSQYGTPRKEFIEQIGYIYGLPCHVLGSAKVTPVYKEHRDIKKSGEIGSLQFKMTKRDNYRLPVMWVYHPSTRIHLYQVAVPLYYSQKVSKKTGRHKMTTNPDKALKDRTKPLATGGYEPLTVISGSGEPRYKYEFYGDILKNKVDPTTVHTIQNPTVSRVMTYLSKLRKRVVIQ